MDEKRKNDLKMEKKCAIKDNLTTSHNADTTNTLLKTATFVFCS